MREEKINYFVPLAMHMLVTSSCTSTASAIHQDAWFISGLDATRLLKLKQRTVQLTEQQDDLRVLRPTEDRWLITQFTRSSDEARHPRCTADLSTTEYDNRGWSEIGVQPTLLDWLLKIRPSDGGLRVYAFVLAIWRKHYWYEKWVSKTSSARIFQKCAISRGD